MDPQVRTEEGEVTSASALLADLRALRPDAKALARSGNPALRAEGKRALVEIELRVRAVKRLIEQLEAAGVDQ